MAKKKAKMGRPPIDPKKLRSAVVPVRFTVDEHRQLLADAQAAELTVSSYLVECWKKAREE